MTVIYPDPVQVYAGDTTTISVKINGIDYSDYDNWKAQWRVNESSTNSISAEVSVNDDYIDIKFTSDQTRSMMSNGVIDLQTSNYSEIKTWVKFNTQYDRDVTR